MKTTVLVVLILGLSSSESLADANAGAKKAQICALCHKPARQASLVPLLDGQPPKYLYGQLKAFKEKRRSDATMQINSASLSDRDMRDLADFFAAQMFPNVIYELDESKVAAGKAKSKESGCEQCHFIAVSKATDVPRIAGQTPWYVAEQLQAFAAGKRTHADNSRITPDAALSVADTENLAHYFAQLK